MSIDNNKNLLIQERLENILQKHSQSMGAEQHHKLDEWEKKFIDLKKRGLLTKQEYKPLPKFDFQKYYYSHKGDL